jgi:hypothetical protein
MDELFKNSGLLCLEYKKIFKKMKAAEHFALLIIER